MPFVWIVLYMLAFTLKTLPIPGWIAPFAMALYGVFLVLWCVRHEHTYGFSFRRPHPISRKSFLHLPVILTLPLWQILRSGIPQLPPDEILILLSAVLAEEVFFRGFLLQYLRRKTFKHPVILSACLFALLHGVNLFSGYNGGYVLLQILLACICGIYWGLLSIRFHSLLPCILAHGLLNLTGAAASDLTGILPGLLTGCLIMLAACFPLYKSSSLGGNS